MRSSAEVVARLSGVIDLQREILTALSVPERILDLIVARTPELTNGTGAVVEIVHGEDLVYRAASGPAGKYVGTHLPMESSLSGRAVRERMVMRCNNTELDARVDGEACRTLGIRSMIIAPLLRAGGAIGALKSYSGNADAFDDIDTHALELVAGFTSTALTLAEENRERGAAEKRYRMLFEKNVAGVFRSTLDGRILDCNDSLVECLGFGSKDELLSLPSWELYQQRSDREKLLVQLQGGTAVRNARMDFKRKDGSPIVGIVNISLVPSDEGESQLLGTFVEEGRHG